MKRKSIGSLTVCGLLAVPALLLSLSVPGMASEAAKKSQNAEVRLSNEVRHQLVMLPFYSVFDNLEYRIENHGTVILAGEVVRPVLKTDAGTAVRGISGVAKVINNIEVLPASPFDDHIRRAEFRAIYRTPGFERYAIQAVPPIHIIVDNGNVTLVGVVGNKMDKILAGLDADGVPNVFRVTNDLRIG